MCLGPVVWGGENFSSGAGPAAKYGVHEVEIPGGTTEGNPFDVVATVTFRPPSGEANAKTVPAFYDGQGSWRARVYVSEVGQWQWSSQSATNAELQGKSGGFRAVDSPLRGRLLPHPRNPRQWVTENGQFFLNLSDTAYFLLCSRDGNGDAVADDDARRYVRDDVERGITAVRCYLASAASGFSETPKQWSDWYFADEGCTKLRLENLRQADHRLRMLLNEYPDVAVQLILFPLEAYARDDRFWTALSATQRERLLRNLVARFAAYPQLQWLIVNDAHFGEKFPSNNALAREVGSYLQKHDPWEHPRSIGHARRVPFFFGGEAWATYVHIEHAHDLGALQYGQYDEFAKPVFLGEDRYEQDHGPRQDPKHMRYWQRRLFWAWLLSGGSTNYGGRWWAVQPYSETGMRSSVYHKRPAVTFTAALAGLGSVRAIRDYFEHRRIDLGEFVPDQALVEDAAGGNETRSPRLMRRGNDEFLIYHPHAARDEQEAQVNTATTARIRVDLRTFAGQFAVEWFRAEDGAAQAGGEVAGGAWQELSAPWGGADVVLRLTRK
jgi:hypothetical protein